MNKSRSADRQRELISHVISWFITGTKITILTTGEKKKERNTEMQKEKRKKEEGKRGGRKEGRRMGRENELIGHFQKEKK